MIFSVSFVSSRQTADALRSVSTRPSGRGMITDLRASGGVSRRIAVW